MNHIGRILLAALCITALAPGSEASPEESQEWVFTPARVMMSYDAAGNRVLRQVVKQQIQYMKSGNPDQLAVYPTVTSGTITLETTAFQDDKVAWNW